MEGRQQGGVFTGQGRHADGHGRCSCGAQLPAVQGTRVPGATRLGGSDDLPLQIRQGEAPQTSLIAMYYLAHLSSSLFVIAVCRAFGMIRKRRQRRSH